MIAFSDSSDFDKVREYIETPHQYFLCLNSFRGILLAGTDLSRIIYKWQDRPINPSEKIKAISISNNLKPKAKDNVSTIELSDRLNVIIGGRGKGKSSLLDAIVYGLSPLKLDQTQRKKFIQKFSPSILNYKDKEISTNLNFVYYSQANITKIFDGDRNEDLTEFFEGEFLKNSGIGCNIDKIKTLIKDYVVPRANDNANIDDDFHKLRILKNEKAHLVVKEKDIALVELAVNGQSFDEIIKGALGFEDEFWNESTSLELSRFTAALILRATEMNKKVLLEKRFSNLFLKKIREEQSKLSAQHKAKVDAQNKIRKKLKAIYKKELQRVYRINSLYSVDNDLTTLKLKHTTSNGEEKNKFYFVSVVNEEHPVEFARRVILDSVDKRCVSELVKDSNEQLFAKYAFSTIVDSNLKESVSITDVDNKLKNLEGIYAEQINKLFYYQGTNFIDLHIASPGTQTNAVMEYIFHSDETSPILIDQPEDNIDNEARYSKLTKWIKHQKYKRQIVLVTHDANIVINGDAECVIVANYDGNSFSYVYGALESGTILDDAARILDGGKKAIKRRIDKYGE